MTTAAGKKVPMTLKGVLVVPILGRFLFSISAAIRAGASCIFRTILTSLCPGKQLF